MNFFGCLATLTSFSSVRREIDATQRTPVAPTGEEESEEGTWNNYVVFQGREGSRSRRRTQRESFSPGIERAEQVDRLREGHQEQVSQWNERDEETKQNEARNASDNRQREYVSIVGSRRKNIAHSLRRGWILTVYARTSPNLKRLRYFSRQIETLTTDDHFWSCLKKLLETARKPIILTSNSRSNPEEAIINLSKMGDYELIHLDSHEPVRHSPGVAHKVVCTHF